MAHPAKNRARDPLTGLAGYDAFLDDIAVVAAKKKSGNVSIVLVDIDEFGKINDRHGSDAGDAFIAELADSLQRAAGDAATVYRYGGDAFMLLFAGLEKEQAFLRAEDARKAFEGTHTVRGKGKEYSADITISCGVASIPDDAAKAQAVIRKCHEALYRAKVSGRNKVCIAREEKMVTKTTHYTQGQLEGLSRLAKREGMNEASLLREALDDLLRKRNS